MCLFGTMCFIGLINGHSIQILLDGDSDDNFIQLRLAKFLQLDITPTHPFKVLVGNGNSLQVEGLIKQLHVKVQGNDLYFSTSLLLIFSVEIIFRCSFPFHLPYLVDYRTFVIQFYHNKQYVTLQGE